MKIKKFKYLLRFLLFIGIFCLSFLISFCLAYEKSFIRDSQGKLKVKVIYSDNPNEEDFFKLSSEASQLFEKISSLQGLNGLWKGVYELDKNSIYWINSQINKYQVYRTVSFGTYNLHFQFVPDNQNEINRLIISQDDIEYGPVNVELVEDKQVNYWTKATNGSWVEIIRGKCYRKKNNELFTVFQTTVYEEGIPIYAFRGESNLIKVSM